jgi:hypothetical protein
LSCQKRDFEAAGLSNSGMEIILWNTASNS